MLELQTDQESTEQGLRAIELLRDSSLPRLLAAQIEGLIVSGALAPGQHVNELVLAKTYGVSRGPLREALGNLTAQGLLVQQKNRGTFVRQVDAVEARDIYALREIMELAAVEALALMPPTALATMIEGFNRIVDAMVGSIRDADATKYYVLNLAFHELLISASGNQKMLSIYRALVRDLVLFRRRNLRGVASMSESLKKHRRIVEAFAARDFTSAREQVMEHIGAGRIRVLHRKD